LRARCTICGKLSERHDDITEASDCPICGNQGHLRPHIVWVGEEPLRITSVYQALATPRCSWRSVPTSATSRLKASSPKPPRRRPHGGVPWRVQPRAFAQPEAFDVRILGPLTETLPEFVNRLIAES